MPVPVPEILSVYDANAVQLGRFTDQLRELLKLILGEEGLKVSQIGARLKKREELHEKLLRETATYKTLHEVTDVVGLRIITFFPDEVNRAAGVIEQHFNIDWDNSV